MSTSSDRFPRRRLLRGLARLAAGGCAASLAGCAVGRTDGEKAAASAAATAAWNGRLRQSLVYWCWQKKWDVEGFCRVANDLGVKSIEIIPTSAWPTLKRHGLVCALHSSHGFDKGMNNPRYHPECIAKIRTSVDECAEAGFPNVITFTGFREDIPDDVGLENCVKGLKEAVGYAEAKKVTLCLEMLNSRVSEEMKGHPGYQGDHVEYCIEILRRVGSPRLKLLFDVYHVQVMDGDVIARMRKHKEWIGHYHTAGVPGRCEIGPEQEINYRPIFREIAASGYAGYVAHEFVPTRDPLEGLREAVALATV
jgi:hydroxypyruvate isomerase